MGLTMGEKKAVTRETAKRCRKADKKGKHKILDEFTSLSRPSANNPKYAVNLLSNCGETHCGLKAGEVHRG